jgi:hypothetical protein
VALAVELSSAFRLAIHRRHPPHDELAFGDAAKVSSYAPATLRTAIQDGKLAASSSRRSTVVLGERY